MCKPYHWNWNRFTRQTRSLAILCCLALSSAGSGAEPPALSPDPAPGRDDSGSLIDRTIDRTLEVTGDWWTRSRDFAIRATDDARAWLEPRDDFASVWTQALPRLDATLTLEERHADLPERAWFGEDRRSNQRAINALLDEAVDILATSPVQRSRARRYALETEIEQARAQIAEYRQLRVSAPTESVVKRTVADYDRLIAAREERIRAAQRELADIRRALGQDLRGMGLELSDEQLDLLLTTVVGDNMVDLGIVFDNVKAITLQLEQLVADSAEDLERARRYYGLYVVLLRALSHMHLSVEEAIVEGYLPQIDAIIARAQRLAEDTQRLLRESAANQAVLDANREAQRLTIDAAGLYREYLLDQAKQVAAARTALDADIAAAWNTYETVRVSGELVGLVRASQRLLEDLSTRQVPVLRPFENLELQREFQRLTEQLRGAAAG